jgi:hypothetical protein
MWRSGVSPTLRRQLFNALRFEIGWLACVLGGSTVALGAGALLIGWHLWRVAGSGEWRLLGGFALAGLCIDGGFALAGGFTFNDAAPRFGPLPLWLWLWMLWPLFATLVRHSLGWLWHFPRLAMLCGGLGGALSYYGGSVLAGVELAIWLLPAEALVWALLCALLSRHKRG